MRRHGDHTGVGMIALLIALVVGAIAPGCGGGASSGAAERAIATKSLAYMKQFV